MKIILKTVLVLTLITAFKKVPDSSLEIINKAIEFHDPTQQWKKLNAQFTFKSSFSFNDSIPEELKFTINNQEQVYIYNNIDRRVHIEYRKDTCIQHSNLGSCNDYSWTKNFYSYIWGLPMKLTDSAAQVQKDWSYDTINNYNCYKVQVNYEAENFQFYFDINDFQLRGFSFLKNDSSGKGEIIFLEGLYTFNAIKFPKKRTWLHLDYSLIGNNEVEAIKSLK